VGGWVGGKIFVERAFVYSHVHLSIWRMALQGCLIFRRLFRLKLAVELEERQRRIIQTIEKTGSQENWSGQDSRLIDIWFTGGGRG
jgi:hypothetical protein